MRQKPSWKHYISELLSWRKRNQPFKKFHDYPLSCWASCPEIKYLCAHISWSSKDIGALLLNIDLNADFPITIKRLIKDNLATSLRQTEAGHEKCWRKERQEGNLYSYMLIKVYLKTRRRSMAKKIDVTWNSKEF